MSRISSAVDTCVIGISIYKQPLTWLMRCVRSALGQGCCGITLKVAIRIDGTQGCDDSTIQWLWKVASAHREIIILSDRKRLGTFGSYRTIFQRVKGDYICQLDADDWLEKNAIAKCIKILKSNPDAPFVYTDCNEVSDTGEFLGLGARSRAPFDQTRMLVGFTTFHLRVVRREAYQACYGYDGSLLYTGDYDLSLKLCEQGDPVYLPEPLYNYRIHGNNTSSCKRMETVQEAYHVAERALTRRKQHHKYRLDMDLELKRIHLRPRLGPILIAGMHRSGTSILALMMKTLGIDLGLELLGCDEFNPDGYAEDKTILGFQRNFLHRISNSSIGWRDWGWEYGREDRYGYEGDDQFIKESEAYLESRRTSNVLWGWKDPRNTLLLDHWLELDTGMRVIMIYRYPWEVVDALQRLKPPVFLQNPEWCTRIWIQYNSALLDFARRYPEKCIIINSNSLLESPERLIEVLIARWELPIVKRVDALAARIKEIIRPELHKGVDEDDPLVALYLKCTPKAAEILSELDNQADIPSPLIRKVDNGKPNACSVQAIEYNESIDLSIVVTSFNQGDLLIEALASIERYRGNRGIELIIVDDGSTQKRTLEVLSHLEVEGYSIHRQENRGLSAARNTGIRLTTCGIVLFLDDDNRLLGPYFTYGIDALKENATLDVIYGNRKNFGLINGPFNPGPLTYSDMWKMNRIDNCALIRRRLLEQCGGYATDLPALEDWDLWLNAIRRDGNVRFGYLNMTCFEYRVRPRSMIQRLIEDTSLQKEIIALLRQRHGPKVGRNRLS